MTCAGARIEISEAAVFLGPDFGKGEHHGWAWLGPAGPPSTGGCPTASPSCGPCRQPQQLPHPHHGPPAPDGLEERIM